MERVKRNVCRTQLTKTCNNINVMLESDYDGEELHTAIQKLKLVCDNLKEADRLVEPLLVENLEEEYQKTMEYQEVAVTLLSRLEYRMERLNRTNDNAANIAVQSHTPSISNNVKLQRQELLKFDGNVKSWLPFWEQFNGAVHENPQLTNGDRFNYLRMFVLGKAAETINGFPPFGAFYEEALGILKERFGNKEQLIEQYVESLMKLQQVRSRNDISALRKNYDLITSATRALKILEVPSEHYNIMLKSSIIKSLPTELRLGYFRMEKTKATEDKAAGESASGTTSVIKDETDRQLKELIKFMRTELESLEQTFKAGRSTFDGENAEIERRVRFKGTATSLMTTHSNKNPGNTCFFCRKDHKTEVCDAALTLERKKELLRDNRRCYRCTKENHNSRVCANKYLKCNKCKGRHATSMCDPNWTKMVTPNNAQTAGTEATPTLSASTSTAISNLATNGVNVLLQTACVYAGVGDSKRLLRLIIDGGSQLTFIKENVSRQLGFPIVGQHKISIAAFGDKVPVPARLCNRVLIELHSQYDNKIVSIEAIEVPEICMDIANIPCESVEKIAHLQLADRVPLNAAPIGGISVLIGADNYWAVVTGKNKRLSERLVAVHTQFGYALHGPVAVDSMRVSENLQTVLHAAIFFNENQLERLWDLESIGIKAEESEINDFVTHFSSSCIDKCERRYVVKLPWKNDYTIVEDNYLIGASVRAERLKFKLSNIGKFSEYNTAIKELINNDYAELVNKRGVSDREYYMPHRPVFREDKDTTKLRVVFDASAHAPRTKSLNDMLEKGPNLNPDLINVLLNFRLGLIGLTADIEKAFLQILIDSRDKDAHRFLWYNDEGKMQTYRMKRVTFGVTCSPFLLSVVIQHHLRSNLQQNEQVVEILKKGFYVDDLVTSVNDRTFAKCLKNSAVEIFHDASINLRKWVTNDNRVQEQISADKVKCKKILGINWCTVSDRLNVDLTTVIEFVNSVNIITKRNVLQTIARVYDPIGLIGPFLIRIKILFQRVWKEKPDWDDIITVNLCKEWNEWVAQLKLLTTFSVPRCLFQSEISECQLHIFADASLQAYGVVAYIRSVNQSGEICVTLLCAKNRVAPLKGTADAIMTLPRLELTAALLAARLQLFLNQNLTIIITETVLWTDSQITLHWIKGDCSKWKPYVSNRVREIQTLSKDTRGWYHCPGSENPADLLTRGISAKALIETEIWQKGPVWLQKTEADWPIHSLIEGDNSSFTATLSMNLFTQTNATESLVDAAQFSHLDHLLRVTAYVLRFINNCRFKDNKVFGDVSLEETEQAERFLIKACQYTEYGAEIDCLKRGVVIDRDSKILTLNPFIDDNGILRVRGRLENLDADFDVKHPIILPNRANLNKLIINKAHTRVYHSGVNATLYEIRLRFWIIRARQLIKSVLAKCIVCKILRGKAASTPFTPLPRDRITQAKPFEVTGLDFAGPLYFKEDGQQKGYVLLFTCAVTRAVHLELVSSMNTETSILALRRFMARRGIPTTIDSDNAKTFKRLSKDLTVIADILKSQQLNTFTNDYRIKWKFIVERAAWWGGFWERLVKSVKDALRASVGRFLLNKEELTTLITEIETTINSRPLTYIGEDPNELLPLTPAHFLLGTNVTTIPSTVGKINGNHLRKQWNQRMQAVEYFWKRWSTEYLQQLRSAHHNIIVRECKLKVGDVVLIHGNDNRRLLWKMGVIEELIVGRDGKVRACKLRCANSVVIRRPVQLLYPLEIGES